MDFTLTEEHQLFKDTARKFAEKELALLAAEADNNRSFPMEVYRKVAELGFVGQFIPEVYGGAGGDLIGEALIMEELARVSPGFAYSMSASSLFFGYNILKYGTEEQKKIYLP